MLSSNCSAEPYFKFKPKGGCEDIFFLTTLDKAPAIVSTVFAIAQRLQYATGDIGVYIQPQHHGVSQHVEFNFPYDPADHETCRTREATLRRGQQGIDFGGRLLLAAVRLLGRLGLQPRRQRHARTAHRQADRGPQERPEPREALLLGERGELEMALEDFRADAMRCTRCAYCKWIPFDLMKSCALRQGMPEHRIRQVPLLLRGRAAGHGAVADGRPFHGHRKVKDSVFKCNLCGQCDVSCKMCRYDMEPLDGMRELRATLVKDGHTLPQLDAGD